MAEPYSYRRDPSMPSFPDDRPIFVFDGVCVLCSGAVRWLLRHDHAGLLRFATTQSPLGRAIYAHYRVDRDATYLLLDEGCAYIQSEGYLRAFAKFGGGWRVLAMIARLIPRALRDLVYDTIARHRYRWFGKTEYCALIPPGLKERLLD
ncbi:MAG TPA: DCC1-like thiol-disulfide oxidoreductase family protein [Stellaceae bacterium]|nr:DCC1-like thiol-disulfide oxidoreductase family protein [Stellaceae bacterium]